MELLLRENNLDGGSVLGVRNGVIHYANSPDNAVRDLSLGFFEVLNVSWVADH